MLNPQNLLDSIDIHFENSIIPSLSEYIKIPNKSPLFDKNWEENGFMQLAVDHIYRWCETNALKGMCLEVFKLPGRTPLLFIEVPGDSTETILIYGHLDKQPEMTGWSADLEPWQPVLKDGKLYGRGSADDGYAVYAAVTAISALQKQNIPHARCIILIEASEESGSIDLPHYLELLEEKIGKPNLVICLDSGAGNYEQLWMTTSLRGNIVGNLSVELLKEGVHSGYASGLIADSFRVARQLLSRIENENTGEIAISELACEIPPARINEAADCANRLGQSIFTELPHYPGVEPLAKNPQQLILNRTWRPTLTITGVDGIPNIEDAGNVLRPKTVLKLSIRTPPLVDAKRGAKIIEKILTENPPYGAKVSFDLNSFSNGWQAPLLADWLAHAVMGASMQFFKKPAGFMGEGGTIPFMSMLGKKFPDAQFMITGVLGPHSNAHGPNEFLHIDMAMKVTASVAFVISEHFKNLR